MRALKEWASAVGALEGGEQTVVLRKGGILDPASGLAFPGGEFLLYPTREHQDAAHLKERFRALAAPAPEGAPVPITSYAVAAGEGAVESDAAIAALSPFHVWSDEYVRSRMEWMPQRPLRAAFLRVYAMDRPAEVAPGPEHAGCRSWIDAAVPEPVRGRPVLGDAESGRRLELFGEALAR